jgi:disulfide oxidoreductase YuzD
MDLPKLKTELFRRLEYSDETKEATYQKARDAINRKYPDDGWRIPQDYINDMANLKKAKIREIRKDLGNDEGFQNLVSELDNIKANKEKKEDELKRLIPPNKPSLLQKFYTSVYGKINNADTEINTFNKHTYYIQSEIVDFQKIISGIETLIPIYNETQGGAKTKKRRNQNSNKSRKNFRKSNCRY